MRFAILPRCLRAATALGAAVGLSSCLDLEQNLILNPDGSGKVTMTTALSMPDLGGLGGLGEGTDGDTGKKLKPREQAREIAVGLLRAEGIEAWSDVSYGVGKDGKTRAAVTGFFPDVTKVKLSNPMDSSGEKDDLGVSKNSDGNWVLEDSLASAKEAEAAKEGDEGRAKPDPVTLTEEEIQDKLDEERQQWAGMKVFMSAFFDSFRMAMTIQGGGTIIDTTVFEKKDERTAALEINGKKLVASVDALLQDDDKAKALIKKGVSPTDSEGGPEEFFKMMFGGDGKMRVTLKPGEPAFNYASEVAKAKSGESAELRALLEDAKKPAKKSGVGGLSLPGLDGGEDKSEPDEEGETAEGSDNDAPPAKKKRPID